MEEKGVYPLNVLQVCNQWEQKYVCLLNVDMSTVSKNRRVFVH